MLGRLVVGPVLPGSGGTAGLMADEVLKAPAIACDGVIGSANVRRFRYGTQRSIMYKRTGDSTTPGGGLSRYFWSGTQDWRCNCLSRGRIRHGACRRRRVHKCWLFPKGKFSMLLHWLLWLMLLLRRMSTNRWVSRLMLPITPMTLSRIRRTLLIALTTDKYVSEM